MDCFFYRMELLALTDNLFGNGAVGYDGKMINEEKMMASTDAVGAAGSAPTPQQATSLADGLSIDYGADNALLQAAINALPPESLCDLACTKLNDSDSEAKKAVVNYARKHLSSVFHDHLKPNQQPSSTLFDVLAQGGELSSAQQDVARTTTATVSKNWTTESSGAAHWSV